MARTRVNIYINTYTILFQGTDLEGGNDDQIYYMLVDDGAQLENQTILIDEAQLAAAGGRSGNVIIQVKNSDLVG